MRIYLDHNATTPVRPEVAEAMERVLREVYGNPSSVHAEGARARRELWEARERCAALVGVHPEEVIFTAGATEANNLALFGTAGLRDRQGRHLVSTRTEHPSVEAPLARLEQLGFRVTRLAVDRRGLLDPAELEAVLGPETALVSILWANNETGVIQPMEILAERVHARGIPLHVDATQALGKIPVDLGRVPADLLSASGHKLGGPKGVGMLVRRRGLPLEPFVRGGGQEGGLRGGTENVPGAVGFGVACELALRELEARQRRYAALRDRLFEGLRAAIADLRWNGGPGPVLPNTLNACFPGASGEFLLQALDLEGVSVSAGAACHSGSVEPSGVLLAMGLTPEEAGASLRLSVGHGVDEAQIDRVVEILPRLVARARELAA